MVGFCSFLVWYWLGLVGQAGDMLCPPRGLRKFGPFNITLDFIRRGWVVIWIGGKELYSHGSKIYLLVYRAERSVLCHTAILIYS